MGYPNFAETVAVCNLGNRVHLFVGHVTRRLAMGFQGDENRTIAG